MEPSNLDFSGDWSEHSADFFKKLFCSLPGIIYVNKLDRPGDINSFRNVYINQRGLDFVGYTQEEVYCLGIDLFREMIHPEDMGRMLNSLTSVYSSGSESFIAPILRVKPKGQEKYRLIYCSKIVQETFGDGTLKQVVVNAVEITNHDQQLIIALKEIRRLNEKILSNLSEREKEILQLIVWEKTSVEIAALLFISNATVKKHRDNMIQKTGVHNSAGLVKLAVESGEY